MSAVGFIGMWVTGGRLITRQVMLTADKHLFVPLFCMSVHLNILDLLMFLLLMREDLRFWYFGHIYFRCAQLILKHRFKYEFGRTSV